MPALFSCPPFRSATSQRAPAPTAVSTTSPASPFGTPVNHIPTWACSACTFVNQVSQPACAACHLPPASDGMWACVQCSYLNCNDSLACEVCYVTNVNANHMDVVWEWTPDNEVWIPYGKFTARKIEAAYRNDKQKITLRGGFFSTAPDAYHFRLDKENNVYYQVNLCSRKRRPARRRSAYDALVSVDIANIDPEDRCIMCQELCSTPFAQDSDAEDNDDADNDVVKLTGCGDGHYFHRDCIAGYLLLRASCPVCFTPIESS